MGDGISFGQTTLDQLNEGGSTTPFGHLRVEELTLMGHMGGSVFHFQSNRGSQATLLAK
jgi:hypothetical protein